MNQIRRAIQKKKAKKVRKKFLISDLNLAKQTLFYNQANNNSRNHYGRYNQNSYQRQGAYYHKKISVSRFNQGWPKNWGHYNEIKMASTILKLNNFNQPFPPRMQPENRTFEQKHQPGPSNQTFSTPIIRPLIDKITCQICNEEGLTLKQYQYNTFSQKNAQ